MKGEWGGGRGLLGVKFRVDSEFQNRLGGANIEGFRQEDAVLRARPYIYVHIYVYIHICAIASH